MTHHDKARELVGRLRDDYTSYESTEAAMEAADLISELINALEYAEANDKSDAMTPLIQEAQRAPGYWSIYAQALELVSNRYSKSALVHLTACLMMREQAQAEENRRLREALNFYADIAKYPAPLTGGAGELYFDCGQVARTALSSTGASHD